jgi:hypothetical protein
LFNTLANTIPKKGLMWFSWQDVCSGFAAVAQYMLLLEVTRRVAAWSIGTGTEGRLSVRLRLQLAINGFEARLAELFVIF